MSSPAPAHFQRSWTQEVLDSQAAVGLISLVICLAVFVLGGLSDVFGVRGSIHVHLMLAADALISLLVGALVFAILNTARVRHRNLLLRLEIIAQMNHHIRNALYELQLSAHVSENRELVNPIANAVSRIEWTLREMLPQTAFTDLAAERADEAPPSPPPRTDKL